MVDWNGENEVGLTTFNLDKARWYSTHRSSLYSRWRCDVAEGVLTAAGGVASHSPVEAPRADGRSVATYVL